MRLALEHRRVGFAEHLDMSERKGVIFVAEIEIVEPQCLLKARRVRGARNRDQSRIVVAHVMTADDPRAVAEPRRVRPIGRTQQQCGRVNRAAGDDDDVAVIALDLAIALYHHSGRLAAASAGFDALDIGAGQQGYIWTTQRRRDTDDMSIRLGLYEAREAVAGRATDAGAVLRVLLVEHDADRQRERVVSGARQIVRQLLDA